MPLDKIAELFEQCIYDAAIFERAAGGTVVEVERLRKEDKTWIVVAAGLGSDDAQRCFPDNSKRAERAQEPVQILPQGRLSLLLVVRPIDVPVLTAPEHENVTTFAPGHKVPLVQVRNGSFVRCWDLPDSVCRVNSFRWELDWENARRNPQELWMRNWQRHLEYNPAHSASHLHLNSLPFDPKDPPDDRFEHSSQELRLCVGVPNPLGLILSIAAWLRAIPIG